MQITVVEHPLIKHKLSKMRDINSTSLPAISANGLMKLPC